MMKSKQIWASTGPHGNVEERLYASVQLCDDTLQDYIYFKLHLIEINLTAPK